MGRAARTKYGSIAVAVAALTGGSCGGDEQSRGASASQTSGIGSLSDSGTGIGEVGDETGEKLDAGAGGTGMNNGGDCPGQSGMTDDEYEFSYIWIANSPQGTVSKINTFTGVEEGRYTTGPGGDPDPSRTSVNQFGDVAVANRNGGIVKIAANEDNCVDANGDGTIQTSTGPADILPWGSDECVLWYDDLPATGASGPRPIAWEPVDSQCGTIQPRVWVGYYRDSDDTGIFQRRDGSTGAVLDEVEIPQWDFGTNPRPYGGAVNADGDFWVTGYYGPAIRIDAQTLQVEHFPPPNGTGFYGMALDTGENIWIGDCEGAIDRFDAATQTFSTVATIEGRARGGQVDDEGMAWFAGNNPCRLIQVDTNAQALVDDQIALPGCSDPVGVSIDVEGFVWVVDRGASQAYKVDPGTKQVVLTVTGLIEPYTYSDMTGHGLGLVANPPQG